MDSGFLRLVGRVVGGRAAYRSPPLFRDPSIEAALRRDGYCVTSHHVSAGCVARLDEIVSGHAHLPALDEPGFTHALRWGDPPQLPAEARGAMEQVLLPEIQAMTVDGAARIILSAVQVKPSAPNSALLAHQDSPVVDEADHYSVNAWVSLQDSDEEAGRLFVLPGSHAFGNHVRVASPEDDLAGLHEVIRRHARPLTSAAGQVVLLDHALIHGSSTNSSGRRRAAVSCHVLPRRAGLVVPTVDGSTPPGWVDVERVGASVLDATVAQPDLDVRWDRLPLDTLSIGPRGLDALCRLHRALRG